MERAAQEALLVYLVAADSCAQGRVIGNKKKSRRPSRTDLVQLSKMRRGAIPVPLSKLVIREFPMRPTSVVS